MDLETIFGRKLATSIQINGIYTPANSASKVLCAFSEPALFYTEGMGDMGLTISGSLFKAKIGPRYFALISNHQRGDSEPRYRHEQLCIYNSYKKKLITSNRAIFSNSANSEEFDCLLYEFTEPVESGGLPKTGWYDIRRQWDSGVTPEVIRFCAIGYPGNQNAINHESNCFSMSPSAVWGLPAASKIKGRDSFTPSPTISFNPAGMSGSPVFGLFLNGLNAEVIFSGILTNASVSRFNFIPYSDISELIKTLLLA